MVLSILAMVLSACAPMLSACIANRSVEGMGVARAVAVSAAAPSNPRAKNIVEAFVGLICNSLSWWVVGAIPPRPPE
jgi:hypothetical protein